MKRPPKNTYPNRIEEYRKRSATKVSQQTLADALGVSQPAFSALKDGQIKLNMEKARIIAPFLECQPWELSEELEQFAKGSGFEQSKKPDSKGIISTAEGVELAIMAAAKDGRKPSDAVIDFARENLTALVTGSKRSLSADEIVDAAHAFLKLAIKKK